MLIYKNTFENVKTIGLDFPIEDQYYANDTEAIVADGITRDPIGIDDFTKYSVVDFLKNYPRPSGAEFAAKTICDSFKETKGLLKDRLVKANENVKELNNKYLKNCDYLENDYYGAVAACISIDNDTLNYAYICDSGVIVYDNKGNIKFKTDDDKEIYSDPYIEATGITWYLPEERVMVRKQFRNNPNNIVDGKCVSYGALTGEDTAIGFIKTGSVKIDKDDTIIVYSDGMSNYLTDKEFINNIINFNKDAFEKYMHNKPLEDDKKYGSERTLVIYKI